MNTTTNTDTNDDEYPICAINTTINNSSSIYSATNTVLTNTDISTHSNNPQYLVHIEYCTS